MAAEPVTLPPARHERRVALLRLLADGRFRSGEALAAALGVSRAAVWKQMRVIGATVVTALGSSNAAHGFPEQDDKRKALNEFIRTSGLFDGVIDFDKATLDPQTGGLKAELVPESTTGGPGDKLHPNRAGYLAMGMAIDLDLFTPKAQGHR